MNELQQLTIVPDGTLEQAQAMGLHYEIINAAQAAAESLLALGRKLKQMRDTTGYKHLGFATFADYTEAAVGIRQRQAYTYINLVEKVPARLIEENAVAGVTKLALLGSLAPADQAEVARDTDLANITVADLKALIAERQDLGEQLSLLQAERTETAEAEEIDLDAIRKAAKEEARREMAEEIHKIQEEAALDRKEQEDANAAAQRYKAECDRRAADQDRLEGLLKSERERHKEALRKEKEKATEKALKETQEKIRLAVDEARKAQEQADKEKMDQARRAADQAEKAMEELKMQADPDSTRFVMLFDQLQTKVSEMLGLADKMSSDNREEKANQLRNALAGALKALAEQTAMKGDTDDGKD